jgi:uncharacterized membrane protein
LDVAAVNKNLITPIVALIALLAKQVFGFELDNAGVDALTDGVLAIITLVGIFMHPTKK